LAPQVREDAVPYFIVLRDREGVSGVWSTDNRVSATRWGLELSLTYPGCGVIVRCAESLSALAALEPTLDFSAHVAESLDAPSRGPRSDPRSDRRAADAPMSAVG